MQSSIKALCCRCCCGVGAAAVVAQVKAVVLRINSPGGSAVASDMIAREVQLLRDAGKPVVACMGDVAASGGYYIAGVCLLGVCACVRACVCACGWVHVCVHVCVACGCAGGCAGCRLRTTVCWVLCWLQETQCWAPWVPPKKHRAHVPDMASEPMLCHMWRSPDPALAASATCMLSMQPALCRRWNCGWHSLGLQLPA